ncbi:methylated-DNA--[protein]-cysteine S-methyltransferase [Frigoribacterium sp. ACAM 257]|nr:methylated-DNA--[protein]-cysteine S-methyltransferase [Frigoribacterium sp. ACAM 257]
MSVVHTTIDSPVGALTLVGGEAGLTGLWFVEHRRLPDPAGFGPRSAVGTGLSDFVEVESQLSSWFAGERRAFDLPLAPVGTEFRQRVWQQLAAIPWGETRTYGQLALDLGDVRLARAVGTANGANPVSIIVPCHRVVGSAGSLTGYAGGLDRKRFLLDHEAPAGSGSGRLF